MYQTQVEEEENLDTVDKVATENIDVDGSDVEEREVNMLVKTMEETMMTIAMLMKQRSMRMILAMRMRKKMIVIYVNMMSLTMLVKVMMNIATMIVMVETLKTTFLMTMKMFMRLAKY